MAVLHIFPVFAGGDPAGCLKYFHKVFFVVIPDLCADLNDPQIRLRKQPFRLLHADSFQIIDEIAAGVLFKEIGEQGIIHGNMVGNHRHVQVLVIILLNIDNCLLDLLLILIAVKAAA